MKEAQYNCCWNANYCNEACQQAHWPEHMKNCVQVRQSQTVPTTPAPDAPPTPQPRPSGSSNISVTTPTDPQTFVLAPPPRTTSTAGHIIMPQTIPATVATQQSPREIGVVSEPMLQYAESAQADSRAEHPGLDQALTRIEHIPNDSSILGSSRHQASQHMKTLLLQQAAQHGQHSLQQLHQPPPATQQAAGGSLQSRASQHGTKNSVIAGGASALIRHSQSASLYQPLMAQVVDGAGAGAPRDSSPHRLPPGLPPPASPGSPASEHSSVHNPPGFSWPYQQPVIISSTDGYPMPLLPALQSSGAQQQAQPFFKAF